MNDQPQCVSVSPVDERDIPAQFEHTLRVSGLAVDRSKSRPALVLTVQHLDRQHPEGRNQIVFALSVPAAAYLSRALRRAVKDYLGKYIFEYADGRRIREQTDLHIEDG
jgi:hypothetical protein